MPERKIGEKFDFNDKKYECKVSTSLCDGCGIKYRCIHKEIIEVFGDCMGILRNDGENVVFAEVKNGN